MKYTSPQCSIRGELYHIERYDSASFSHQIRKIWAHASSQLSRHHPHHHHRQGYSQLGLIWSWKEANVSPPRARSTSKQESSNALLHTLHIARPAKPAPRSMHTMPVQVVPGPAGCTALWCLGTFSPALAISAADAYTSAWRW